MPDQHPMLRSLFDRATQAQQPVRVTIEITHRCHLACTHCYLQDNHSWDTRGQELTTAEICSVFEQVRAEGCLFLAITGGEIFLRKDILTLIGHARQLGMAVILLTSGTLLSDRIVSELAKLHPWRVEFSLYSTDPLVHDGITERPGSHARTMAALHKVRDVGIPVVIKSPLMRQNFDSYEALRDLAQELGIAYVADVTLTPKNDGNLDPTSYRLTTEQLVQFYRRTELEPYARIERRLPRPDERICTIGTRSCLIGPFGDVYACMGFKSPVGNLRQQSFAEIWHHSPLLGKVRRTRARDLNVCSSCDKFAYCNRCAGTAHNENGDFYGPSEWACHLAAAKERAAGIPVTPSAAEKLGMVEVLEDDSGSFTLRVKQRTGTCC